jgi:hypothetical protein
MEMKQMATKRKTTKKPNPSELRVPSKTEEEQAISLALMALRPTVQAAVAIADYDKAYGNLDLMALIDVLGEQASAVAKGDLKRGEAMLTAQAHTLDAIFSNLARRAINAEYLDSFDRYLKLALRAQSQCRATWEALATIKNPPVMGYVRQANIAQGPQQVNNASPAPNNTAPRAGKNPNLQNKLLEETDGERLDTGAACTPGQADPEMATVGEIDGTENRGR